MIFVKESVKMIFVKESVKPLHNTALWVDIFFFWANYQAPLESRENQLPLKQDDCNDSQLG